MTPEISELISALSRIDTAIHADDRVMTCGEAAYLLNKTPQTISRYINQGKLKKAVGNGVIGVRKSDLYLLMIKNGL